MLITSMRFQSSTTLPPPPPPSCFIKSSVALPRGGFRRGRHRVGMLYYAKKSINAYVAIDGGHVIEVQFPFPIISNKEIMMELGKRNERKVGLMVIDHITSMPSVVITVMELTITCMEEGMDQLFVDAAHDMGSVEVHVKDIGVDFYTSNLHKWIFCPPLVAILYSWKSTVSSGLHHPMVSNEYGIRLTMASAWLGTRDYEGQPRRHSLTTGWNAFVNKKKLISGVAVLFLRSLNGELRLVFEELLNLKIICYFQSIMAEPQSSIFC
ncbi:hypothetical protein ZOSMA_142G00030 [Zostera marina]|uniref:Aminotransferase class V domain-containing protein n=1 Tax=Zostera marina TaxID=29655 RepID=A0A0K9PXR5_ZOSMR|nr:hypothetical protein ZOSMA_142G00030 [Zostera marina]